MTKKIRHFRISRLEFREFFRIFLGLSATLSHFSFAMPPKRVVRPRVGGPAVPAAAIPARLAFRRREAQERHNRFADQRSDEFRMYERVNPGLLSYQVFDRLPGFLLPQPRRPRLRDHADALLRYIRRVKEDVELRNAVNLGPNSWIRIGLHSMNNNLFISTKMVQWRNFNIDTLLRMFTGERQDGDNEEYDEAMEAEFISLVFVGNPDGSGYYSVRMSDEDKVFYNSFNGKILYKSHSFSSDHMCAQRSLVLLMASRDDPALFKKLNRPIAQKVGSDSQVMMYERAIALTAVAGVSPTEPVDFTAIHKLATALTAIREHTCHIIVLSAERNMEIVYRTLAKLEPGQENYEWFCLVLRNNHYDGAPRIHRVMHGQANFCFKCFKTYNHHRHVCANSGRCILCDHINDHTVAPHKGENKFCNECFRTFSGDECYNYHISNKLCAKTWKCLSCNVVFQRPKSSTSRPMKGYCKYEEHVCGYVWCSNCHKYDAKDHDCYVKPTKPKEVSEKYVFADFETDQSSGEHVVNLAVSIEFDGSMWPVFYNIHDWVQHMLLPQHKGKTFIFHNGRGFDFHPILNQLMLIGKTVKPTMCGRKVIFMNVPDKIIYSAKSGRRFIDSVNFLPMPLKSFSKTFDLEVVKGHYPHFFNTVENRDYVGELPEKHFYGYELMNEKDRKDFDAWYDEEKVRVGDTWSNTDELLRYCIADVQVLRQGCLKFRSLVMESMEYHDPFQSQTLSGSAMCIFRTLFLQDKTIGAFKVNVARDLRSAFNGGRVEAFKLYKKCKPDERIAYVDFTSLYPFCNARCVYPVGHPICIDNPESFVVEDLLKTEEKLAVLCVDIICPPNLYVPLLHSQDEDGLLMFDLRPKYAVKYTNLELRKAVSLGYTITQCYRVYIWDRIQVGIFAEYMKRFLKIKQEAAGWPSSSMTDDERQSYLREFENAEKIALDESRIKNNDGLYKMAKLYLNSLWGKFAQRNPDMFDRTSIIHDTEAGINEFNTLRSEHRITDCYVVNEKTCLVKSKPPVLNEDESLGTVNISIGIFTTAHARLKLYNEFLEPIGARLLYCDTDSCIFYYNINEDPNTLIKLGNYLGDPTSEVGSKNEYDSKEFITEFVSGGPKHYAYKTSKDKTVLKVKGLNMRQNNVCEHLTFDSMKQIVLSPQDHALVFHSKEIRINYEHELVNTEVKKTYQLNFTKRRIMCDCDDSFMVDTEPWKDISEIKQVISDRKARKRKRDEFDNQKGFPVYVEKIDSNTAYFKLCEEEPQDYLIAIHGFKDNAEKSKFISMTSIEECKHETEVFSIIKERIKCDWVIQVKCKTNFFDHFDLCRIIKHVHQ